MHAPATGKARRPTDFSHDSFDALISDLLQRLYYIIRGAE